MKRKQLVGLCFMIAMIIISIPIGMNRSLDSLRDDAERIYYYDQTGYAIYQGIQDREDAARNILKIAEKYQAEYSVLESPMQELENAVSILEHSDYVSDSEAYAQANRDLSAPAQEVADILLTLDISDSDIQNVNGQIRELNSAENQINRSNYNDEAVKFNQKLEKYPAKLMKDLGFVKTLPDYRS